jgi:hypothetical protein
MIKRVYLFTLGAAFPAGGVAVAQQFPILDKVAGRVVQEYQSSTCEQLWAKKGQKPRMGEEMVIERLKSDPAMRTEFLNRVAAPIANKMFECGMIP